MLTAEGAGEHGDLDSPLLIALLIALLEVLSHLLLGVLESLICLLRIRPTLLDIVKTLVAWAYRVLVGLESAVAIGLLLILALFGFQKNQLFQLRVQVLNKEMNLIHYQRCLL